MTYIKDRPENRPYAPVIAVPAISSTSSPTILAGTYSWRGHAAAVWALTKPRLAAMSVLSTLTAYATAGRDSGSTGWTLVGTALAAAGALSLNQWWERRTDALMERTRGRPLPQANISPGAALRWSLGFSLGGCLALNFFVNPTAAMLALATILIYGVIYTPLKRRSRWATEIGSISGALPALLGNAAAGDLFAPAGLTITGVLLFWQMPHFFAIGWLHRADYRAAGFPLLPAIDSDGRRTARWSLGYTLALVSFSLLPCALGWFGAAYMVTAVIAGVGFLVRTILFLTGRDRDRTARQLFLGSLLYLPAIMAALMVERFFQ